MDQVDRIIEQWADERSDLDTGPMATIGRTKRLAQALNLGMENVFRKHGLNNATFDVLATLRRSGPPYALTPSDLMASTMVSSGTMTNRIDRLQKNGWISRTRNPDDGRGFVIGLTDQGFRLIDSIMAEHVANQHRLTAALSEAERKALDILLSKWLSAFEGGSSQHD